MHLKKLALALLLLVSPAKADDTISNGLTVVVPSQGSRNWGTTFKNSFATPVSGHDHTGGGKGLNISTNALSSNAVTDTKIRLTNDGYLRARNSTNSGDLNVVKANSSNKLVFGTNISSLTIEGGVITGITDLAVADGGTGASTASGARTNLELGSIATQDSSSVSITGGVITGITDLAVADGGTGASTASGARTNLELGTIATQDASNVTITGGTIGSGGSLSIANGARLINTAAGSSFCLGGDSSGCATDGSDGAYVTVRGKTAASDIFGTGSLELVAANASDGHVIVRATGSAGSIFEDTQGIGRWQTNEDGHKLPQADNSYDLGGASKTLRNIHTQKVTYYGSGPIVPVEVGITATGTTSADAYLLSKVFSEVSAGGATTGTRFPAPVVGQMMIVKNSTGTNKTFYPHTGGTINNGATDAGRLTGGGGLITCYAGSTTAWFCN